MHIHIDRIFTTVSRNLGIHDFSQHVDSWIEWAYEAEKLIGSKSTFKQKESTYTSSGAKASGSIKFSANPTSGDSITLNGVELFFRNSTKLGKAYGPNDVAIGTSLLQTITRKTGAANDYGLLQSLKGFLTTDTSPMTGQILSSAALAFPEAINVANYSIDHTTTGDNLLTNGDFSVSTGWNNGSNGCVIASGEATITIDGVGTHAYLQQSYSFVSGKDYAITFKAKGSTTNQIRVQDNSSNTGGLSSPATEITLTTSFVEYEFRWTANSTSNQIIISRQYSSQVSWNFTIDDVVVKEIDTVSLNITSKEIGPKGNDYTLSSNVSNALISGLNLTGGKGLYTNQQLTLPEDNLKLLAVRVGKDDSSYENSELRKTSAVHRERVGWNNDDSQQRSFRYYVDGNRLNIQHDDFDEITIVYLAFPVDLRGWPMIKEGHETAVAQYIMWQMKLIEFYNGRIPQYITKELEKRWYYLCGQARGNDSMPTSEELNQIGKMWNTLIPLKNTRGLIDF